MKVEKYDLITLGRSCIDLYSQDVGAPFNQITGFDAFVGGSPLNIAVATSRLGIKTSLLTGVGNDKVGEFIIDFLKREKVNTKTIPVKEGSRTSAAVLGIQPPDNFPLVFYRDNAADSMIDIDDVINANISKYKILLISGTALNIEPTRSATFFSVEVANKNNVDVVLDLDFRADQWKDIRSYGLMIRAILPNIKIVIGTEEEILASTLNDKSQLNIKNQQISSPEISGDINNSISQLLSLGIETLIVKRGKNGATIFQQNSKSKDVPGFPVKILNVLGAGDAFAGGFLYGILNGWDLYKSCRMGNASGAQVVTKKGCANFMPTLEESMSFIKSNGGF
ncbi:MAG: 5-dehydro-2-deoxygluconokinase [Flavobacteriales bacterium]|jgi:5-dehydro-2-deoxygluconokinase|nr:5-dehydro-2-deoxygluconokinase [Flavobacteriales bacterium]|tara:strand:- start:3594 stop:4607 length:1014 start_codon:yes stop_codon:yes gene_type:complete